MVAIAAAFEWNAAPSRGAMCVRERPVPVAGQQASEPRLLDRVAAAIRLRHYSRRTEKAYTGWIRRFILFHGKRHPAEMAEAEITRFLNHLAVAGKVSASTQNQALSALLFLYRDVLGRELPWMDEIVRAKRPQRFPVVHWPDVDEDISVEGILYGVPARPPQPKRPGGGAGVERDHKSPNRRMQRHARGTRAADARR